MRQSSQSHRHMLPSLHTERSSSNKWCDGLDFSTMAPVVNKHSNDYFGKQDFDYTRSLLRTPPKVRRRIATMKQNLEAARLPGAQPDKESDPIGAEFYRRRQRHEQKKAEKLELQQNIVNNHSLVTKKRVGDVGEDISATHKNKNFEAEKYVGPSARSEFQTLYKKANRDFSVYLKTEDIPEEVNTPRSMYLRELERQHLPPLPLILRKAIQTNGVYLPNRGLGDSRIMPLVEIIDTLPNVEVIDFKDNRLTDDSLISLTVKLQQMETLTHLDLSFNKMDCSSETIMDYLRSYDCKLNVLMLNGADVDDAECGNLAEALTLNTSLSILGLSNNLIGKSELENSVNADVVTGGKALATMLLTNTTLTKLDLGWNGIRGSSAEIFADALTKNSTLRELYIGNNTFGDLGTQVIGRSLKTNQTLTALDLSFNSLTPKAGTVLANSLVFNETINFINLDGNVLGKVGAQAIVAAIQRASGTSRALKISFNNCDCRKMENDLFDAANPAGIHHLDLTTPYGMMVAEECLYLANYRAGVSIPHLSYSTAPFVKIDSQYKKNEFSDYCQRGCNYQSVRLIMEVMSAANGKFVLADFQKLCLSTSKEILAEDFNSSANSLTKLLRNFGFVVNRMKATELVQSIYKHWMQEVESNLLQNKQEELHEILIFEVFFALFVINDDDFSGTMDVDEFLSTMESLSMDVEKEDAVRLMNEFDKDKSGTIDANEFSSLIVNEFCRTEAPRGRIVDASTGHPWVVPHVGHIVMDVLAICDAPSSFDVGKDCGVESIISAIRSAKTDEQKELIFEEAVQSPYFFLNSMQAQIMLDELCGPVGKRTVKKFKLIRFIATILPQLVNSENCCKVVEANLDDSGKLELRIYMGPIFCALLGSPTGHYLFDMKNERLLNAAKKLATIANSEAKYCREMNTNTSQHGDFSNFRNEQHGTPQFKNVRVNGGYLATCPQQGRLRFDYVSTTRPRQGTKAVSTQRLEKLAEKLDLHAINPRLMQFEVEALMEKARLEKLAAEKLAAEKAAEIKRLADIEAARIKRLADEEEAALRLANSPPTVILPPVVEVPTPVPTPTHGKNKNQKEKITSFNRRSSNASSSAGSLRRQSAAIMKASLLVSTDENDPIPEELSVHEKLSRSYSRGGKQQALTVDTTLSFGGDFALTLPSVVENPVVPFTPAGLPDIPVTVEEITITPPPEAKKTIPPAQSSQSLAASLVFEPFSLLSILDAYVEYVDSSDYFLSVYPEERQRDASRMDYVADGSRPPTPQCLKKTSVYPERGTMPPIFPFAYQKMVQLQVHLSGWYLSVTQMLYILGFFPEDCLLRVQVFVSFFSRIIDFDNMPLLIDKFFSNDEQTEIFHRVGVLNLLDSMTPDRFYRLDLRRWDHREFCKILIVLAMTEPGENWIDETYRWSKYDSIVPGWEMPNTWTEPDEANYGNGGPRNHGWLLLTYTSTSKGCAPNMASRRNLRRRVLAGLKSHL